MAHLLRELFRLDQDISERKNLYAENPDKVKELKTLLEKYKSEGRSTPGKPQKDADSGRRIKETALDG